MLLDPLSWLMAGIILFKCMLSHFGFAGSEVHAAVFLFCAFLLIIHTYVKINHALCVCLHSYMMMRGILCIWTGAFLWCGLVLLDLQCISCLKAFEQSCMSPPIRLTAEGGMLFIAICYFPVVLLLWYPNSSLSQILLYSLYTTPFLSFCFCFFSVHYIS